MIIFSLSFVLLNFLLWKKTIKTFENRAKRNICVEI